MLILPDSARVELERWVRDGYPRETCGVLVGRREGERNCVVRCVQARNVARERAQERFELDARDFMEADVEARDEELAILGVWHSHPDRPAVPSERDRAAAWEDWSYLILSVGTRRIESVRCWRIVEGRVREEEIRAIEERARAERAPTIPRA